MQGSPRRQSVNGLQRDLRSSLAIEHAMRSLNLICWLIVLNLPKTDRKAPHQPAKFPARKGLLPPPRRCLPQLYLGQNFGDKDQFSVLKLGRAQATARRL